MKEFQPLYSHERTVYNIPGFRPETVDARYLQELGVKTQPSPETLEALRQGSLVFEKRFNERLLRGPP